MGITTQQGLIAVRELSFDRFPIPTYYLQKKAGYSVNVTTSGMTISNSVPAVVLTINWDDAPTFGDVTDALNEAGIVYSPNGYFKALENSAYTLQGSKSMNNIVSIVRRFFYSDDMFQVYMLRYAKEVLREHTAQLADLPTLLAEFDSKTARHFCLWCAITSVDDRRIYEMSSASFGKYFSDGSGLQMMGNVGYPGDEISVNIGDVFSMQQDTTATTAYFSKDYNLPGSDNVLGDKDGFWYKLYIYLRDIIEQEFSDDHFRKETGFWTDIKLEKPLNLRTYFDSYPYTLSPLSRGILP